VYFRVKQVDGNPNGTVIENSADIFFDYNAPIKTNIEFHTVGDVYDILLSIAEIYDRDDAISIYPNPFRQQLNIELDSEPIADLSFEIHDIHARVIRKCNFSNTNRIVINNLNLQKGIYFYRLMADKHIIGTGKIAGY